MLFVFVNVCKTDTQSYLRPCWSNGFILAQAEAIFTKLAFGEIIFIIAKSRETSISKNGHVSRNKI